MLEERTISTTMEVRTDGRTVCGIAAPFDAPTEVRSGGTTFTEVIRPGAFASVVTRAEKVKLFAQHDHKRLPLGRAALLREDPTGLYGEFRVSRTQAGDEVLALVADGALDSFSIGFEAQGERWSKDRRSRELTDLRLYEVSLVAFPAYADALVTGLRAGTEDLVRELVAELTETRAGKVLSDANKAKIIAAVQALEDVLAAAGIDEEAVDEGAEPEPGAPAARRRDLGFRVLALRATKRPYGDVLYADPGYQPDRQARYPIDTKAHALAAWSYINQTKNQAPYTADQLRRIKDRIVAALKRFGVEVNAA